jgi:hypothetical protein
MDVSTIKTTAEKDKEFAIVGNFSVRIFHRRNKCPPNVQVKRGEKTTP